MSKIRITHIINPVKVDPGHPSYLYFAQPITFESFRNAKQYIDDMNLDVEISLYTAQYEEDVEIIPNYFTQTPNMDKSCLDYFNFAKKDRKLPLIRDILYKLYDNCDAEYLIYSNVDISLKPNFYKYIYDKIKEGYDGLTICRWDLGKMDRDGIYSVNDMEKLYKLKGRPMPGYDCFVFHRYITKTYIGIYIYWLYTNWKSIMVWYSKQR